MHCDFDFGGLRKHIKWLRRSLRHREKKKTDSNSGND